MLAGFLLAMCLAAQEPAQEAAQEPPQEPIRRTDSITVEAQAEKTATTANQASGSDVKELPSRPSSVRDALPLIPGVLRTPQGKLVISSGPEHRSSLLVNSTDVTDPATGSFGATIPIDTVASMNVYQSPFLAEYGRFTAGVVEVETKRGADKWRYELNDPTPELRIRSAHLVGIRAFTPRFSFSGPVVRDKLYLSQAIEYRLNKTPVFTQEFPNNETKREAWNSLTQLDWIASPAHLVTLTLHGAPQKISHANLGFYNPIEATPNLASGEYRLTGTDLYTVGGGTLETAFSAARTDAGVWGQGEAPFLVYPNVNGGNYFGHQDREASRYQFRETWTPAVMEARGSHHLKFGAALTRTTLDGRFRYNPVEVRSLAGDLLKQIDWINAGPYLLGDWESAVFVQDQWNVTPVFALDAGARADFQHATRVWRVAPRAGFAWSPLGDSDTTIRAGMGWFFDRVPLNVFAFPQWPAQVVSENGVSQAFPNRLGMDASGRPLVFGPSRAGNFAPQSRNWSVQLEQRLTELMLVRARYIDARGSGLLTVRRIGEEHVLNGFGDSRMKQFEVTSRLAWKPERKLFFSYVHSRSRGYLNDFAEYLGDYPSPFIRPDIDTETNANIPHRFLAWGVVPFQHGIRLAPVVEYRTGFPYSALEERQNYFGIPNSYRFPAFFSLDLRVSKDIQYRGHAVRLSFSAFNLTNHWNPEAVRLNAADPQFGEFLGQRPRRFRVDLDFLF
jgi:hypothetical protein